MNSKKSEANKLERIFSATLALVSKVGIAGIKMSSIAEEANIATGTVYLYFKNKSELLNALYAKLKREGIFSIMGKIDHLPTHIQLYKLWSIAFEYHVTSHCKSIFMEQFEFSPLISKENIALEEDTILFLNQTLDRAKSEGIIKDLNNHLITSLILGFLRNLAQKYSLDLINITPETKDSAYALCWDAIKKVKK